MDSPFRLIVLMLIVALSTGCVSSSLHTAIKQLRQDQQEAERTNVNEGVLQRIQLLRIQQKITTVRVRFSFSPHQSQLVSSEQKRLEKLLLSSVSNVILHIAPATADSGFAQIVLATHRADEVFKLIALGSKKAIREITVKFDPKQTVDTLIIVLES